MRARCSSVGVRPIGTGVGHGWPVHVTPLVEDCLPAGDQIQQTVAVPVQRDDAPALERERRRGAERPVAVPGQQVEPLQLNASRWPSPVKSPSVTPVMGSNCGSIGISHGRAERAVRLTEHHADREAGQGRVIGREIEPAVVIEVAQRELKDLAIGSDTRRESTGPVTVERGQLATVCDQHVERAVTVQVGELEPVGEPSSA